MFLISKDGNPLTVLINAKQKVSQHESIVGDFRVQDQPKSDSLNVAQLYSGATSSLLRMIGSMLTRSCECNPKCSHRIFINRQGLRSVLHCSNHSKHDSWMEVSAVPVFECSDQMSHSARAQCSKRFCACILSRLITASCWFAPSTR